MTTRTTVLAGRSASRLAESATRASTTSKMVGPAMSALLAARARPSARELAGVAVAGVMSTCTSLAGSALAGASAR